REDLAFQGCENQPERFQLLAQRVGTAEQGHEQVVTADGAVRGKLAGQLAGSDQNGLGRRTQGPIKVALGLYGGWYACRANPADGGRIAPCTGQQLGRASFVFLEKAPQHMDRLDVRRTLAVSPDPGRVEDTSGSGSQIRKHASYVAGFGRRSVWRLRLVYQTT